MSTDTQENAVQGVARVHISEILNVANLETMIAERMINVQEYPDLGLRIYNYSRSAQYTNTWNQETRTCRGLITDLEGFVVARGFVKFANVEQHGEDTVFGPLPIGERFEVLEKLDGKLGILHRVPATGELRVATRGSLQSDQAKHATALFQQRYGEQEIPDGVSYLFEIIYPQYLGTCPVCGIEHPGNRIVVDYQGLDDLVLLDVLDNATGLSLGLPEHWPGPVATRYDVVDDFDEIVRIVKEGRLGEIAQGKSSDGNFEGFVIRFASGVLCKAKDLVYQSRAYILAHTSAKTLWQTLAEGKDIEELLDVLPDEFDGWVRETVVGLQAQYDEILAEAMGFLADVQADPGVTDRKSAAARISPHRLRGIVFQLLDERDPAASIWKMIEPAPDRPLADNPDAD